MLTVELIEEGEVSPYLTSNIRPGDKFELRGPIGGYFVWTVVIGGPLFLVAGGSGMVPLMSMLRYSAAVKSTIPALLLYSSRTFEDIIYREELDRPRSPERPSIDDFFPGFRWTFGHACEGVIFSSWGVGCGVVALERKAAARVDRVPGGC